MKLQHFPQKACLSMMFMAMVLFFCSCLHYPSLPLPIGKSKGIYHTVRKNETLWRICRAYGVNMQDVAEINNIKEVSQIKAGDRIFIPGATRVKWIPLPTTTTTIIKHRTKRKKTTTSWKRKTHGKIIKHTGMFQWPVRGKIIKRFGVYNGLRHDGINIKASYGTPVKAAASGRVVFSDILQGYGNTIIIQHKNGYATIYANNSVNLVGKGKWVKRGQKIAQVGTSTGKSRTAYLHFQIRRKNKPRNPLFYLPN